MNISLMKRFKLPLFTILIASFVSSCVPPTDPIPDNIFGRWELVEIDAFLNESSAPPLDKTQNYEGRDLFFDFLNNNRFTTNTDLGLNKLLLDDGIARAGTYDYYEEQNKDKMILTFDDPQLGTEIELHFEIQNIESTNPILYMNKNDYINSLRESADNLPREIRDEITQFSYKINEARFSLTFLKD